MLLHVTELAAAEKIAGQVVKTLSTPFNLKDKIAAFIGASVGGVVIPEDEEMRIAELVSRADQLMYKAKLEGKNSYCLELM